MSNILEQASLVLIPSGYKSGKIYSQIPTIGDGDLQFTRASNATRVNSAGLIEKVRTNLALYSEDLTNAAYIPQNATLTGNTTTAPDGTTTADTFNEGTLTTTHRFYQQFTITANQEYAFSFFAKKNTLDIIRLVVNDLSGNFRWFGAQFNLTSGTITATATGSAGGATYIGGSITDAGNGWYRCSINGTINTTTALCFVHSSTSTAITSSDDRGGIAYAGTSRTYFGWGTQFETGVTTDYIPTTTAAVSVGMTADVPRLDYLGSSCPSLLLEPQRTNSFTFSEQINDASWTKFNATITANASDSPDGNINSDKVVESATTSDHGFFKLLPSAFSANAAVAISVFAKYDGRNLQLKNSYLTDASNFDLQSGTVVSNAGAGVGEIVNYGNGWYRCILKTTANASGNAGLTASLLNSLYAISYAGDGTSGALIYGCQLETGSYATSYIPTLGTSVTRVADAASKTGISDLIGQTEGTVFVEANLTQVEDVNLRGILELNDGTTDSRISVYRDSSTTAQVGVFNSGIGSVFMGFPTASKVKIAFNYSAAGLTLYVNGSFVNTDTSVSIPTCSRLDVGSITQLASRTLGDTISQVLLFKTQLSNTELAQITSL
jgi:hypothetical protein